MRLKIESNRRQIFRNLSTAKMQKRLHEALIRLWKDAIREFIKTVINNIGVDSGMSGASLKPLAANVGLKNYVEQSLRGRGASFSRRKYSSTKFPGSGGFKSKAHGAKLGGKAYTIKYGTPKVPKLEFVFEIVILQFYLNELGLGEVPPWNALDKGRLAFLDYIDDNFKRYVTGETLFGALFSGRSTFKIGGQISE